MTLLDIENKTKTYADIYNELSSLINAMDDEIDRAKNKYVPRITELIGRLEPAKNELESEIKNNKHLFSKPKSQIFHNIRVGLAKGKGKKIFDNDKTVKLIKKHFPRKLKQLIETKETVVSKALEKLNATELKKIGVEIKDAKDGVIIKPVDTAIKKIIDKIISEIKVEED